MRLLAQDLGSLWLGQVGSMQVAQKVSDLVELVESYSSFLFFIPPVDVKSMPFSLSLPEDTLQLQLL
jgi:hypothetical protein